MGLIKGIFGKICHIIKNFICHPFIDSPCNTSRHIQIFVSIDKVFPLLCHHIRFFLGHGTAHQIASSQVITSQLHNNLHDLFLVNNTTIGRRQNFFQLRTIIDDGCLILFSFNIFGNKIHRARTIKGNSRDNILQTGRF